jgi:hypothetical protein
MPNYHIHCGFPAVQIRFLAVPDLPQRSRRPAARTPDNVAVSSAAMSFICCIPPFPVTADHPIKGVMLIISSSVNSGNCGITEKVGSGRNGHPVI